MNPRTRNLVLAVVAVLAFGWGLNRLFELRFATGDVFPVSSSRRADPIGSKALHESLARLPGLRVRQNLEPLRRVEGGAGSTLVVLGIPGQELHHPGESPEDNEHLIAFARKGGRLVLALEHESASTATNLARQTARRLAAFAIPGTNAPGPLETTLGFTMLLRSSPTNPVALRVADEALLPAELPWSAVWHQTNSNPAWRTVYAVDGLPVVCERPWGSGTVVIVASDYLLSNEALRTQPQPAFISWLIGPSREIIFDETHLGLSLEPGVAGLLIKYRLGGAAIGFLLLAGLYLWRSLSRFNPPPQVGTGGTLVAGRGSAAGLLNILRRAVSPAEIVACCMQEWRETRARQRTVPERRIADAQDLINLQQELPPRERNPVDTYRRISQTLNHR